MTVPARAIPTRRAMLVALIAAALGAGTASARDAVATLSAESITTADRLTLDVAFTVAPGWTLEPWAASARTTLEDAGWTVVSVTADAPALADGVDGSIVHRGRIVLEPFLPGEYNIPAIGVAALAADGTRTRLSSERRPFTVASVLPEDEPLRLPLPIDPAALDQESDADAADAPLGALRAVPDEPAPRGSMLALLGAGVALLGAAAATAVALRSARELRGEKAPDPVRELERLARTADPDLGAVDAHLRALARRPAADGNTALADLIIRVEHARYAPTPDGDRAAAIADEAARVARLIDRTPVYDGAPAVPGKGAPA